MAEVKLITCDNDCGWEAVETPEARASMVQVVVTQGGSRSHVYDLCPNCASGFATKLPDDLAQWPRYVQREAVREWLRPDAERERKALALVEAGRPLAGDAVTESAKELLSRRVFRVGLAHLDGTAQWTEVWAANESDARKQVRDAFPSAGIGKVEEVSGA